MTQKKWAGAEGLGRRLVIRKKGAEAIPRSSPGIHLARPISNMH